MRFILPATLYCLIVGAGSVYAQERVPPPPPEPISPNGQSAQPSTPFSPPASLTPPVQIPAPLNPYAAPAPYPPYGPPPGAYGPMYGPPPPRFTRGDVASNPNFWFGVESLIWWSKRQPLSTPIITTGPASGDNPGGIGAPGAVSLNSPLRYGAEGGLRLYLGGWIDPAHTWGLDGSLFFLGRQSSGFGANDRSGSGNVVINEPVAGAPFSTLVSAPGVETGGVSVNSTSEFWGLEFNALYNLVRNDGFSVNLIGGFRYLELNETLNIAANSNLFTNTVYTDNMGNTLVAAPPGSSVAIIDQFGTRNQFYGGQAGVRVQYSSERWFLGATGSLAIGATHEEVNINGTTNVFPVNGSPVTLGGGNYATLQSGHYSADKFAVAPSLQLNVGYQFTPFLRGMVGYNFMYLSNVARPGNQIDNTYDGVVHPIAPMASSSFWSQGINLSLQFSY